jgi:hypothetical protein
MAIQSVPAGYEEPLLELSSSACPTQHIVTLHSATSTLINHEFDINDAKKKRDTPRPSCKMQSPPYRSSFLLDAHNSCALVRAVGLGPIGKKNKTGSGLVFR